MNVFFQDEYKYVRIMNKRKKQKSSNLHIVLYDCWLLKYFTEDDWIKKEVN